MYTVTYSQYDYDKHPANIYLFKVAIETVEEGVFNVNIFHNFSTASIVDFEQVNNGWAVGISKTIPA